MSNPLIAKLREHTANPMEVRGILTVPVEPGVMTFLLDYIEKLGAVVEAGKALLDASAQDYADGSEFTPEESTLVAALEALDHG